MFPGAEGAPARLFVLAATPAAGDAGTPGWQLEVLEEKSAGEELAELVALHDWQAALQLAGAHGLPADAIYKCATRPAHAGPDQSALCF